ncbi:MAG: hypothetical protein AAGC56_08150, partial [Pseudomonadota bacterium]
MGGMYTLAIARAIAIAAAFAAASAAFAAADDGTEDGAPPLLGALVSLSDPGGVVLAVRTPYLPAAGEESAGALRLSVYDGE